MPDRRFDTAELISMPRILAVFDNMRAGLALATSFSRRSLLDPNEWDGTDLGFYGLKPDRTQLEAQNGSVSMILVALVSQALENYFELKRLKPRLEDSELEGFLDGMEDRSRFVSGLKKFRNAVFHAKSRRAWRHRDIVFCARVFRKRGGLEVAVELLDRLYAFTDKCFRGDLMIWPLGMDEEVSRLSARRASEGGETFEDFLENLVGPETG